jgi:hypothetical protein
MLAGSELISDYTSNIGLSHSRAEVASRWRKEICQADLQGLATVCKDCEKNNVNEKYHIDLRHLRKVIAEGLKISNSKIELRLLRGCRRRTQRRLP